MLNRIPFLIICISYISGILIATFMSGINPGNLLIILVILISLILIFNIRNSGYLLISVLLTTFLILTGIYRYYKFNPHFNFNTGENYIATVLEYPVVKTNSLKTEAFLDYIEVDKQIFKVKEKLIIYFELDSLTYNLKPGNRIIFKTNPDFIKNQGNPNEFDYRKYMANQKIYRQVYLRSGKWVPLKIKSAVSLRILSEKLRNKLLGIYRENNITDERFAILS
ncbi:MAG: DUF4131 domain-containing protein, partial [Prolixibacteraceae bacterium]|nr:DUF4131 domain-containing protein [Prolixibacteraceae bacterium]